MENRTTRLVPGEAQVPKGDAMKGQGDRSSSLISGTSSTSYPSLVASGAKNCWSKKLAPVQGEEGEGHAFILCLWLSVNSEQGVTWLILW